MEEMYRDYRDIAEFRIVYLREAHAADSSWPMRFARKMGITEHRDYGDRCMVAERMMEEENVTIPCIIDDFNNRVNIAYKAWPTRLFVVRNDGRIAIAASRLPWGFNSGLKRARAWLAEYRKTGKEP